MKKIILAGLLISAISTAQENASPAQNPVTTELQGIIENANNFNQYKIVQESDLKKLQTTATNYITGLDERIVQLEENVVVEKEAQQNIKNELLAANTRVENLSQEKDAINILGLPIDKTVYSVLLWSIIAVLAVALVVIFMQFKKSNAVTNQAKNDLSTAEAELEDLRQKSIEEKQLLGRQLQDERNKLSRLRAAAG